MSDVPVWAFHGDADGFIGPTGTNDGVRYGSQDLIDELRDNCIPAPDIEPQNHNF